MPNKLGSEFQINTYTTNDQREPSVAALSNGNFVAAWESDDGSSYGVYGQMFTASGSLVGSEFQINNYTTSTQEDSNLAALNNGNFVAAWESFGQDGSDWSVYGQVFTANGSRLGSEFQINTYTTNGQSDPSLAALSNGIFAAVWNSAGQDGSGNGVYGQVFSASGSVVGSELQINTYTTGDQNNPSLAALSNGNFVAAWESFGQDGSGWGVYGQLLNATGGLVGSEFRINTNTTNDQTYPSLAALSNGNFVAAWQSYLQDGSDWGVYGQVFNASGSVVGSEFQINTNTTTGEQSAASLATLSNGNFVAAWQSYLQDGSGYGVYGQVFTASGSLVGSEFQINTYTTNNQFGPSLAALNNGNFVAVWVSDGQDGSGLGIYGQLFYGQLVAANYANRIFPYIEETPSSISQLSILGALNDETVNTTLTLSDPSAGSLKTGTSGNVTSTYNVTTGTWQALGYLDDINQLLSTLIFLPAPDYKSNVTLAVNMTDGVSAPVVGSLTLTPIPIGQPTELGSEFQVNTYTTGDQGFPSLAALSNGNFVAVWQSVGQDGSAEGVYGRILNATGGVIDREFQINTYTTSDQSQPSIAVLSNGNFVVVWHSLTQDGSGFGIYGQILNVTGGLIGSEFQINTYTTNDQWYPRLATLSNGNVVVEWVSNGQDGSGNGVYGQILNATAGFVGSEFRINTYTIDNQDGHELIALSNGNFVAVWESFGQDGSGFGVYGQILNATAGFIGNEFRINTYTIGDQELPILAVLNNGNFVAVWQSFGQDGSGFGVYGQILNVTGGLVGSEFQVNTYTTNDQWFPQLATLSNGNFVAVWHSDGQDGSGFGIYGQVLTASGGFVGSEFRINTYTIGDQMFSKLVALNDGNFVAAWESFGQDSAGYGVYGQIFYGQLVAANYANRTLTYTEDTPLPISNPNLSILGALNEYAITATLTLSNPNVGALNTSAFGKVKATYVSSAGVWQAFGHRTDMNQVLSQLTFVPAQNTNQNTTISIEFSDGASNPVKGEINLTAIPVNDPPVLVNNQLTVTQGQAVILNSTNLSALDVDTPADRLTFTVNRLVGGRFEFINQSGVLITSFTQQQITDGQVRFVPDGGEVKPAYDISVSDGVFSTSSTAATVTFILLNKPPVVINALADQVVMVGQPFSFTVPDTTFSDPEGAPLTYSAQQPDGGALPSWLQFDSVKRFFSGTALQAGENTYRIWATDPGNLTARTDFHLNALLPPSNNSVVGAAVGGAIAGLVGLAALGTAAYCFFQKKPNPQESEDSQESENSTEMGHTKEGAEKRNRHSKASGGQAVQTAIK